MNLKADLFPYPVLTPELDDYLDNSSFDAQINVTPESSGVISVAADFKLDNQGLKELVDSGNARYALHVEGVASSYRKLWTNNEDQTFIRNTIFEGDIRKKLQINAMVIANVDIDNYSNINFNNLYYDEDYAVTNLKKGDILAFLPTKEVVIDLESGRSGTESIFTVAPHNEPYMNVELSGDTIVLNLPTEVFSIYKHCGNSIQSKDYFISLFFIPALTFVLSEIKNKNVSEDLDWYQSIDALLTQEGINLNNESTLAIAQRLLNCPLIKSVHDKFAGDEVND